MKVPRIVKTGVSLMGGQGIQMLTQLLLPPLFVRHYSVASYGEWLALTSAASYLGTLNFGLHNFANNHVAIAHNRGDLDEVNVVQATSFSLVLALSTFLAAAAAVIFLLPISSLLHLKLDAKAAAAATTYLLALQLLVRMIFGFLQNAFLVVGAFHRGSNWLNGLQTCAFAITALTVILHMPFVWIAAGQVMATAIFTVLVAIDLYFNAPVAFPKLQYTSRSRVMDILKPSGYFGMLFATTFLVYQLPILLIQRMLGPTVVVAFSTTRTIFSMSRQALTAISTALGPEITELFGRGNWAGLYRLYDLSERAVFALVPLVTLATFLATPALITVWMHRPELIQPDLCVFMALISAAAGIKEHKYQFQISINHHADMARFLFFTYTGMVALTVPGMIWFGIRGFLALWLITETAQILYTVKLNVRLFRDFSTLEMGPLYRIGALMVAGMAAAWWITTAIRQQGIVVQLAITAVFSLVLFAIEFPVFRLADLKDLVAQRLAGRNTVVPEELTPIA